MAAPAHAVKRTGSGRWGLLPPPPISCKTQASNLVWPLEAVEAVMSGPLEGVRILDLTWVLAGPFASMTLCDLGADVIKVERPPGGDVARTTAPLIEGESCYFFSVNRGKRGMVVDLKTPQGRDLFLR